MVGISSTASSPPPQYPDNLDPDFEHHEKYFLQDDYTVLLVEKKLFRVNTRWLETNSSKYSKIRRMSVVNSAEQPVVLSDILAVELEILLDFVDESMREGFSLTLDKWIHLLSIAHKLELHAIKPRAIREVFGGAFSPDPFRQVVLYEAHDVPRADLARAMQDLIVRQEALSEDEHSALSHKTAAEIGRLRENYLRELLKPFGGWPGNPEKSARALVQGWVADGA